MAYPPPHHGFLQNYAMASLMQGQFPNLPMGGLVPLPPPNGLVPHPVGITVPTGVTSVSAAPVRKIATPEYGFYPGLLPPPQPSVISVPPEPVRSVPSGPSITLFIGSITDRASDILIRQMLSKCGNVNIWKRVQGANGKLQAFGYCDFADPESAMRAIRILHDFEIADKKLVVKADAKTQEKLDDYVKLKKTSSRSDDAHDALTKKEDEEIRNQIVSLLSEHEIELNRDPDPSKNGKKNGRSGAADAGKSENLADLEMEEEKRHLINREIDKFRDTYKEDEKESEKEVRREEKKRDRRDRSPTAHDRLRDRNRKRDAPRDRRDRREPDSRSDHREGSVDDEETTERRKLERQLREKESSYQQRLRNWENREMRKDREFDEQKRREDETLAEEAKEAKKLKIFLEDYDDDRDDSKYYRSSIMKSRLRERQKELEEEERDRRNEKRELDELRRRLSEEGHPDPDSEAAKRMNHKVHEKSVNEKIRELMVQARSKSQVREDSLSGLSDSSPKAGEELHVNPFSFAGKRAAAAAAAPAPSSSQTSSPDRVKRAVPDIFNTNDEDETSSSRKRRKLPVLHDDEDSSSSRLLTSEEKKKQIKDLISEIPTARDKLFSYTIEWDFVDKSLMEKRIRPWINKKVTEFIGEQEEALVDFICSKLNSRSSAESILNEVVMILDDEAEVFIVKLWRLLIYEIKAKKAGLAK